MRLAMLIGAALLAGVAAAQPAEPLRQVLPYRGRLDLDGQPHTGAVALRARLYTAPEARGAEACAEDPLCAFEQRLARVEVRSGAYEIVLGEGDPAAMAALLQRGVQLYLELAVGPAVAPDAPDPEWITLARRQALAPAPQTLLTVQPELEVALARARTTAVSGTLAAARVEVQGDLTVPGVAALPGDLVVAGALSVEGSLGEGATDAVIFDDPEGVVVARGGFRNGGNGAWFNRDLTLDGPATALGGLLGASTVAGNLRGSTIDAMLAYGAVFGNFCIAGDCQNLRVTDERGAAVPVARRACFLRAARVHPNGGGCRVVPQADRQFYGLSAYLADCMSACIGVRP